MHIQPSIANIGNNPVHDIMTYWLIMSIEITRVIMKFGDNFGIIFKSVAL